tara:strand:- start:1071 stop:1583 length:513 start_codon:yes stop_codon:yes gene_type:complete
MIVNPAVNKRTTNEVVRLLGNKPEIDVTFIPNKDEGFDTTVKTNNIKITLVLTSLYPFNPPKNVKVEGQPYPVLFTNESCQVAEKIYPSGCMCCSSILCKWAPTCTIEDLIREIIKNIGIANNYYHEQCYFLRAANGGWQGRYKNKPSLPFEICRIVASFLIIPTNTNLF